MARKTPARSYAAPSPPTAQTPFLSQAEQDLAASEQRFRLLVESVTDYAIYMLDPTGVVTNWNSGAQRFKGYSTHEIVGKHFSQFFTREDRQAGLPERILEIAAREDVSNPRACACAKDGTPFLGERGRRYQFATRPANSSALPRSPATSVTGGGTRSAFGTSRITMRLPILSQPPHPVRAPSRGSVVRGAARLKIDQSFVRDLCTNSEDAAVVRTIIYLAHSFGLDVTAEGIELEEQRMRLRELGCESGQGYLFGRPVPATRILELLAGGLHEGTARWSKAAIGLPLSLRA